MTATALVLAAHGSRHEPAVNEQVRAWARQIALRTGFDEVVAAFHQGTPAFREILDTLTARDVTVVPVMTSSGYYNDTVLPRELACNQRFSQLVVHQTIPVGLHPAIPQMIADRANSLTSSLGLSPNSKSELTLALVGHGTPRHPASRNATLSLVEHLRQVHGYREAIALFLDDEPQIEQLLKLATKPDILVIPFLIAAGPHAMTDIPKRIGMSLRDASGPPFVADCSGRRVLYDMPFGSYPQMIDLIVDLAVSSANRHALPTRKKQDEAA